MRDRSPERITDNSRQSSGARQTGHNRGASVAHQRSAETDGGRSGGGDRQQSGPDTTQSETAGQTQRPGRRGSPLVDELARRLRQLWDAGPIGRAKRREKLRKGEEQRARAERRYIRAVQGNAPDTPQRWQTLATNERLVKLLQGTVSAARATRERTYEQAKDNALLIAETRINEPDFRAVLASEGFTEDQIGGLSGLQENGSPAAARRRHNLHTARTQLSEAEQQYIRAVQTNASDAPQRRQALDRNERLVKLLERGLTTDRARQEAAFNTKRDTALLAAAAHLSDPVIHQTRDVTAPPHELERYRQNQDRLNHLAGERQNRQRLLDNPTEAGLSRFGVENVQAERDQISDQEQTLNRERAAMETEDYRRGMDIRDRTYAATRLRLAAADIPGPLPEIREPTQPRFQRYRDPSLEGILAEMRQSQDSHRAVEQLRQRGYYQTPNLCEIERHLADMLDRESELMSRHWDVSLRAFDVLAFGGNEERQAIRQEGTNVRHELRDLQGRMQELLDSPYIRTQEAAMISLASMPTLFSDDIASWLSPQADRRR